MPDVIMDNSEIRIVSSGFPALLGAVELAISHAGPGASWSRAGRWLVVYWSVPEEASASRSDMRPSRWRT